MAFDSELDALFRSSLKAALPTRSAAPPAATSSSSFEPLAGPALSAPKDALKKRKSASTSATEHKPKKVKTSASKPNQDALPLKAAKSTSGKRKITPEDSEVDGSDDDAGLEDTYAAARMNTRPTTERVARAEDSDAEHSSAAHEEVDSDDGDVPPPTHESLTLGGDKKRRDRGKGQAKARYIPSGETREQRDARTVFVGNVPAEAVKSKSAQKQLKRHILTFVPSAKIESLRFRSVAFQSPTSSATAAAGTTASTPDARKTDGRTHDRERAAAWRKDKAKDGEEDKKPDPRLSTSEKKKIAFIKQEIHTQADSVHAYIVFAHADPSSKHAQEVMDPSTAARETVEKANGSSFMSRTLRVDAVAKNAEEVKGDPRRTIFVGNLDFASKEEDLRVFFEGVVSAERGPPGGSGSDSEDSGEEDEKDESEARTKTKTWVMRVRIVRDKDTLLGKGFAYVEFADRECVDELLAMEEGKLKFAKRRLRLQRCKTLPGSAPVPAPKPRTTPQEKARTRNAPAVAETPKGDPELGARLAHLPKDARKAAKAADSTRVARRLAKKKARAALGVPVSTGDASAKKQRERVRKTPLERRAASGHKPAPKKGRARSEKSLSKRNAKK